ncbi:MAG TPA: glycosyltransferase family 2 protein [Frateuria sp.]|uniref:glycosyltransferase family 2 protein n=1 Tax=Frateuria sp. TaxID=2211372 RepID=UPI002D810241|nr:glycosyltransferase family 2 protein [Frateuria sp.]HET6807303.1 glycosyltransferase family 2 protein [Frateuria sp.]
MVHPALSVVLCTYNGAAFVQEQLDSLLCQTRKPDEIVIGDDGSRDDTWSLLQTFEKRAVALGIRTQLVRHERNMGYVENFSSMLRRATGDVLFLCDQDDVWHWDKLATMARRFEQDASLLLLFSNARLVDAGGSPLRHTLFEALELSEDERTAVHQGRAFEVLLRRSMVTGATAAFRRQLVELALPVGGGWIHDEWLAVVAAAAGRVGMIEENLIDYRQHGGNQIGMRKRSFSDKWRDLVRPRQAQFLTEIERLDALHAHLAGASGNFAEACGRIERKRAHFQRRVAFGAAPRWTRLPDVIRESMRGDYRRYGTGGRSVLRDLLRRG